MVVPNVASNIACTIDIYDSSLPQLGKAFAFLQMFDVDIQKPSTSTLSTLTPLRLSPIASTHWHFTWKWVGIERRNYRQNINGTPHGLSSQRLVLIANNKPYDWITYDGDMSPHEIYLFLQHGLSLHLNYSFGGWSIASFISRLLSSWNTARPKLNFRISMKFQSVCLQ